MMSKKKEDELKDQIEDGVKDQMKDKQKEEEEDDDDLPPVHHHHHHNEDGYDNILPSEILYMFLGWLTTREEPITFGAYHEATKAVEVIEEFCKVNEFKPPREDWQKKIKHLQYPSKK